MHLIPVPNLPQVFSIHVKFPLGSTYKAKVTWDTTVELLLKSIKEYLKEGKKYDYKLTYNEQDLQFTDTLKKLGLKVSVLFIHKKYL